MFSMYLFAGVLAAILIGAVVLSFAVGRNMAFVCVAAALVLLGATMYEAHLSDRFATSNVSAELLSQRFSQVPMDLGEWQGEDLEVTDEVREAAGAVGGVVSRRYRNERTGQEVNLWLIVGHARDICRHTPDVCYPSSGFHKQSQDNVEHTITVDNMPSAHFLTNSFIRENATGRSLVRVFWSWHKPGSDEAVNWEAPEYQRLHFGNTRALYKMYFSSVMPSPTETADESVCVSFAKQFLPVVEDVLAAEDEPVAESPIGDDGVETS